jgi:hypothetical protein
MKNKLDRKILIPISLVLILVVAGASVPVLKYLIKRYLTYHQSREAYCNRDLNEYIDDGEFLGPYLLLQGDATTSISINWVSLPQNAFKLQYRLKNSAEWQYVDPSDGFIGSSDNLVHRGLIKGLQASSIYEFRVVDSEIDSEEHSYFFKTPPDNLNESLTFVSGGDMMETRELMAETTRTAAATSPAFAVLGGDLAYDNGEVLNCWFDWIDIWSENAITPQGLSIPMVVGIGNHEVAGAGSEGGGYGQTPDQAKYFYSLFLGDTKSNYVVDFSNYLSFIVLDSHHTQSVESQNKWLESTLEQRKNVPNTFAVFHVPAYGVEKGGLDNKNSLRVRENWVPIFEEFGLSAALEHDHHIYKRSKMIFEDAINPEKGILYIGDGAWGVTPRRLPITRIPVDMTPYWYVAMAEQTRHFIRISLDQKSRTYEAINDKGEVFDRYVDVR